MKKSRILGAITAAALAALSLTAFAVPVSAAESYNAYLGVQEPTYWSFRNAWNDAELGKGTEYFDHITADYPAAPVNKGGTFTDAAITGDGTYSVSLTGDFDFGDSEAFSLLFVSTDMPLDCGATISDVKVKIDGTTKYTFDEAYLNPDEKEYINILCINQWNSDLKELFGYVMPSSSVEIEFTVSGLGDGAAAADTAADAPAADTTTTSEGTGNVPAAVMVSVMAVSGAAVVASRKRK
ncbi:MAG: hypothetical protein J6C96_09985 [Oscillospiraceae bacterium]|nr:hypothetical protein [Oscillospiraceae bacterium]